MGKKRTDARKHPLAGLCKSLGLETSKEKLKFPAGTLYGGPKPNRLMNTLHDILELSTELKHVKIDELEFLFRLDRKLHYIIQTKKPEPCGCHQQSLDWEGSPYIDCNEYTCKKISASEYKRFAEIVGRGIARKELVLYPINTSSGFAVGFCVDAATSPICPDISLRRKGLVTFLEKQLPDGYGFKELSALFKNPTNEGLAMLCGIPEIRERRYYDY